LYQVGEHDFLARKMAEDFLRLFVMNAAFYSQFVLTNSLVPTGNKGRSSQYFCFETTAKTRNNSLASPPVNDSVANWKKKPSSAVDKN